MFRRATTRVLLLLCVMYFITYVDRVNVSTAASAFGADLSTGSSQSITSPGRRLRAPIIGRSLLNRVPSLTPSWITSPHMSGLSTSSMKS